MVEKVKVSLGQVVDEKTAVARDVRQAQLHLITLWLHGHLLVASGHLVELVLDIVV